VIKVGHWEVLYMLVQQVHLAGKACRRYG